LRQKNMLPARKKCSLTLSRFSIMSVAGFDYAQIQQEVHGMVSGPDWLALCLV